MTGGRHNRGARWAFAMLGFLALSAVPAAAEDYTFDGLADVRLVQPSNQRSWEKGGLGKLRFDGGSNSGPGLHLAEIVADGKAQLTSGFAVLGIVRYDPDQHTALDILEGYARFRPVANESWQWTSKAGAFFPPISLENEGVGWTSPWTLTPSAINTWVGEELRTIGGESTVEWRHGFGAIDLTGALFGWDSPAGTLLANRGWALGDRPTGLLDNQRQPDVIGNRQRKPIPFETEPFLQIGDTPGWYADMSSRIDGIGKLNILRYDNRADPTAPRHGQHGWRTKFTSAGLEVDLGDVVLLSQAMVGTTEVDPTPTFTSKTKFRSGYLLAGRYFGDVSAAVRGEVFDTHEQHPGTSPKVSEHGHAETLAVSWRPIRWLRLTAEALRVESYRLDRINAGLAPRAIENQLQLSARVFF